MVGVAGFEPVASWSRTKRSTKLSYTPRIVTRDFIIIRIFFLVVKLFF